MQLSRLNTKVLILTHYTIRKDEAEDTDQRIRTYLLDKTKKIIHITHPLPEFGFKKSYLDVYENGIRVKTESVPIISSPGLIQYIQHIIIIYYFLFKHGFKFDLCIALENLSFISIYPLRALGLIKRIVYYSLDFVPQRFPNPFLNFVYHQMDIFSCKNSDFNWFMVKEQINKRKYYGINKNNSSPFLIVPIGYNTAKIKIKKTHFKNFYNIIYAGALRESMGPQLIIESLPLLIKKLPKIRLTIIGIGKLEPVLKKMVTELKLKKYVEFKGYIEKFYDLTDILSSNSVGLAPYKPTPNSFSYFSDPSKIKLYMCCGLPVITTEVATLAKEIEKNESGIIIEYSKDDLIKSILKILNDPIKHQEYRNNALKQSKKYDMDTIMKKAISKI